MVYPALLPLMHTPRLPVVDWTDDLNGLVRFSERRNLISARVPSHFNWLLPVIRVLHCQNTSSQNSCIVCRTFFAVMLIMLPILGYHQIPALCCPCITSKPLTELKNHRNVKLLCLGRLCVARVAHSWWQVTELRSVASVKQPPSIPHPLLFPRLQQLH